MMVNKGVEARTTWWNYTSAGIEIEERVEQLTYGYGDEL